MTCGYSSRTRVDRRLVHVGDDHGRAVLDQVPDQVAADLADAGDADGAAGQRVGAPGDLGGGAHALEDAVRREHRAVAGAAVGDGAAGDVGALAGDVVHVLGEGARRRRRCSSDRSSDCTKRP